MTMLVIIFISCALRLTSASRLNTARLSRESKWNIIHHEYHGPPAPLDEDGRVIDTFEVAKARSNHLAIHAETVVDLAKKMAEWSHKQIPESAQADGESKKTTPEAVDFMEHQEKEASLVVEPVQKVLESEPSSSLVSNNDEIKPVSEDEITNELDSEQLSGAQEISYEGPFAPIGEDGRVLDTPEVRKAKEAHLLAYQKAVELAKANEKFKKEDIEDDLEWYEIRNRAYLSPSPMYVVHSRDGNVEYRGPIAPIGEYGRVVDTLEVQRAKAEHEKAHEYAQFLTKHHLSTRENNII